MQKYTKTVLLIAGTILLLLTLAAGISIGWAAGVSTKGFNATALIQTLAVASTVGLGVWSYSATKQKEIDGRLFSQKAAVYEELLDTIRSFTEGKYDEAKGKKAAADGITRLKNIQYKAIIWGDQGLIDCLSEMSNMIDSDSSFQTISQLYAQMRRELGHKDRKTIGWDILALQIKDEDRPQIRAAQARAEAISK